MIRSVTLLAIAALATLSLAAPTPAAADEECLLEPRTKCFGIESVDASLSTTQAGDHPDLVVSFGIKADPESEANPFGLKDGYATTRDVRVELPPGLVGDPNVLGLPQQCTLQGIATSTDYPAPGAGCPNGSQVGISKIVTYDAGVLCEPLYMMEPPGGDVVARIGFLAGLFPTFLDFKVRSESDYGLVAEINDASTQARLIKAETTTWGVPADPKHDTERARPDEALFGGCVNTEPRPPGSRPLPFLTNPTRCGVPLELRVSVTSWAEPQRFDTESAAFPQIIGCNRLPFGPSLTVEPTAHRAASPTGADVTIRLPASDGVNVLEPSQMREIRVQMPQGLAFNPSAGDGLETCSPSQVGLGTREASHCPDAAKLASTEFDIPVLERNLRGAVYLREPEPGHPFRIWITADDLGLHVKLAGELEVDKSTGQITEVTTEIPQAPVREAKLLFKSGFRAPLVTPDKCGTYRTSYEFVPWSGGPPVRSSTPMTIDGGCDTGGFAPELQAGTTDASAGAFSPFLFTITREDGEQNPQGLDITLPTGLVASFAGIPRCEGTATETGACPTESRIGKVVAAVGAGPTPLWIPQPGKRPTAVYLSGPYKGAPLSIVAVVPRQAGPFDFGDEVVRSAIYVDPVTAQATAKADPLPQMIEGIPINYRTLHVILDRPNFTLNPTGCREKSVDATVTSNKGAVANPSSRFSAVNCASLPFRPKLTLRLKGGTKRGAHPALTATLRNRAGDANIASVVTAFPPSEFLENAHIRTVCTRADFAASNCPAGAIYGTAKVWTPLFDEPLTGNVYLRSSNNLLPDLVPDLRGPASLPVRIEAAGRTDSVNGGIRNSFDQIPDAPFSKLVLQLQGGRKGLLVNSRDICAHAYRATVRMTGHNGRKRTLHPALQAQCGKKGKKGKAKRSSHRRAGRVG
jgi:hypothetical protein